MPPTRRADSLHTSSAPIPAWAADHHTTPLVVLQWAMAMAPPVVDVIGISAGGSIVSAVVEICEEWPTTGDPQPRISTAVVNSAIIPPKQLAIINAIGAQADVLSFTTNEDRVAACDDPVPTMKQANQWAKVTGAPDLHSIRF